MNSKRQIRSAAKKLVAAALALSFVTITADAFGQQKRGATVIISLRDGRRASGELIAVKPKSILLLDPAGKDASFDLSEIRMIRVFRKSKAAQGALIGLLAGGATGFVGGSMYASASGMCPDCEAPLARAGLGMLGGAIGLFGGLVAGVSAGKDFDIQIDSASEVSLRAALQKLPKYARYHEFR